RLTGWNRSRDRHGFDGPVHDQRLADAKAVTIAQPLATADTIAVDIGPVRGETVVDDRPFAAEGLELRVQARNLRVPADRDVHLAAASDRESLRIAPEADHLQLPIAGTQNQKWLVGTLRCQDGLQLAR